MRIQFAAPLKTRHGDDVKEPDMRGSEPGKLKTVTLGDVACAVLDAQMQDDRDPKEKVRRWELIRSITEAEQKLTPLDVLDSDVEVIKNRILISQFPASICGSAVALLSPAVELSDERKRKAADSKSES